MTSTKIHLTLVSTNKKTGPIPVSTSEATTCPPSCPFMNSGCYAKSGPLAIHWRKVTEGARGFAWSVFCAAIKKLPYNQIWRHNQAGDVCGVGEQINETELNELVEANKGKRGFTYTHKYKLAKNFSIIRKANANGFTINFSANSPKHADYLASFNCGPVVCVLPSTQTKNLLTPAGNRIVVCPAAIRDNVTCATCGLCANPNRKIIIGFPAHGTSKGKIDKMQKGLAESNPIDA